MKIITIENVRLKGVDYPKNAVIDTVDDDIAGLWFQQGKAKPYNPDNQLLSGNQQSQGQKPERKKADKESKKKQNAVNEDENQDQKPDEEKCSTNPENKEK